MTALARSLTAERAIALAALGGALVLAVAASASPRLALYAALALVALVVAFSSLLTGVALFVVLTFPDRLPGSLGIGPTLAKPFGVLLLLAWVVMILGDRKRELPFLPRDAPLLTYTLLAFLVWSFASAIWATDGSVALENATRLAQLVALVFVTYSAIRKSRDLAVLVYAYLVGAFATAIYALANGTVHYGRLTGGIFDANAFAAQMLVALVFVVFLLVSTRRVTTHLLLLAVAVPTSVAFVETQSRSGILALGAAAVAAVLLGGALRGRLVAVLLVAGAIGLTYYVVAAPPQLRQRVTSIGSGAQADPLREDTWHIASQMVRSHPVAGVGLGNFPVLEPNYFISNIDVAQIGSLRHYQLVVHNTYLEILAELGLVGLTLFLGVLAMTWGRAVAAVAGPSSIDARADVLTRAIVVATVGFMTSRFFVSGEYEKQLWLLLGMAVAAAVVYARGVPERTPRREAPVLANAPAL